MSEQDIQTPIGLTYEDGVAELILNRPQARNAIDLDFATAFRDAVAALARANPAAIVVHAVGPGFCVGGDVREFGARLGDLPALIESIIGPMHEAILQLARLGVPTAVAVQGAVAGGGLGLALLGDVLFAAPDTKFRSSYTLIGLSPDCGVTYRLPEAVGVRRAREMILSNRVVDAERALIWGLVDEIVDEPIEAARAEAKAWAEQSVPALANSRILIDDLLPGLEAALDAEKDAMLRLAAGDDAPRLIQAFLSR